MFAMLLAVSFILQGSVLCQTVPDKKPGLYGGVDILSDTQGVDFSPYVKQIMKLIYMTWLPLIPEEGRPPLSNQAETAIRFSIAPTGKLLDMHLDSSTRQENFDRAAWGAITGAGRFPPLPKEFTGPHLELRVRFLVNKKPQAKP